MNPRGSRRGSKDDLLLLTLALRRRRLRHERGHPLGRLLLFGVLVVVPALLAATAFAARTALHVALTHCSLDGRQAKTLPTTSLVYARNGYYLGAIPSPVHRQPVSFKATSRWIRKATVAAEDRTFWTNGGVDLKSIARAAIADVAAGRAVQGGSTITQQLVRNLYLNDAKTLRRKRLEACLARKLTAEKTKRQILTEYLDRIPYGAHALGIEAASRTYFGIPARRLGPAQAALLAGLPRAPTDYNPLAHPQRALARRNQVLRAMRADGMISARSYRKLVRRPLGLHPGRTYARIRMPNFFSYVESQLVAAYGRRETQNGGLRVYTTLDPRAQTIALNTMRSTLGRRGDPAAALASIEPRSGAIRTLATSWHGHRLQFDLAANGARQTGSAFKTFVLTDAVWLHHADPNRTWYKSSAFTYQPTPAATPWTPHTYENRYFGPETLTKATQLSDNVVYAKLTLDVGPSSVAHVAHLMGIHSRLKAVPSIGLGSNSVTPLALASAYATLAANGVYRAPHAIRKVVLPGGQVDHSHHWGSRKAVRILPAGVAWTVTKVLEANVQGGTGLAAQMPGRQVAGKTGTTTNWTDAWFAGYTPRLTTVTWVGYPRRPRSMSDVHGVQVQGATFPTQIWHSYMVGALGHVRPAAFRRAGWVLRPYVGPRSMSHPPGSKKRTKKR